MPGVKGKREESKWRRAGSGINRQIIRLSDILAKTYIPRHAEITELNEITKHMAKRRMSPNVVIKLTSFGRPCVLMMWTQGLMTLHKKKTTRYNQSI